MSEILTKSRARNIFYGGSLFFVVVSAWFSKQQPSNSHEEASQ